MKLVSRSGSWTVFLFRGLQRSTAESTRQAETKTIPFCIDSMGATCLLRMAFAASEAPERRFSNCISGKEELTPRDETLPGPFGCTFKQKIQNARRLGVARENPDGNYETRNASFSCFRFRSTGNALRTY